MKVSVITLPVGITDATDPVLVYLWLNGSSVQVTWQGIWSPGRTFQDFKKTRRGGN